MRVEYDIPAKQGIRYVDVKKDKFLLSNDINKINKNKFKCFLMNLIHTNEMLIEVDLLKDDLKYESKKDSGNPNLYPYIQIQKYVGEIKGQEIIFNIKTEVVKSDYPANENANKIYITKYVNTILTFKLSRFNQVSYTNAINENSKIIYNDLDITEYARNITYDDSGEIKITNPRVSYINKNNVYSHYILTQYRRLRLTAEWLITYFSE